MQSEELIETARAQTGLDDLGDIPYAEPLDVIVDSLNREARLDEAREAGAAATLIALLAKRLRLVDDRKRNPSIADEQIVAPVFIVGLPRTGSTHLHALMSQVEGIRTPRYWEMQLPSPPPEAATFDTDPRIAQIQAIIDHIPAEMLQRHPMAPQRPEQCNMLNDWSLIHQALLAYYEIPSYHDWLFNADYRPAFEAHRRTLQHLQWHCPGQWVLKYPKHLIALDVLLEAYPDARIIWTHRDPGVVLPSVCSFTGYIRSANPSYDPLRYGPEWTLFEELVLRRGLSVRDRMADADTRIHDLYYRDLMADPVAAVAGALEQFDIPFSEESARSVQQWIDAHSQTEHGVHRYTAEEFGLDRDHLRERFSFYIDRFDVAQEVRRVISGEKILISGVSGTVAQPLATYLAQQNEVWGIARFAGDAAHAKEAYDPLTAPALRALSTRETLEAAGITTRAVDLGAGEFDDLPDDFTYVLHLAWMRADLAHLEDAMRTNVEGAGLLLQHCRKAKAALVMSGMGIYSARDDPWHAYTETDPIGRGATAYAPTSPASKLGVEAVARFCAHAFDLPVVITRLNTFMGVPTSFPGMHIHAVLEGQTMVAPCDPNPHTPIHLEDMRDQLEALLDAAATTALITNWCGDDVVTAQEWVQDAAAWSGKEGSIRVQEAPGSPAGTRADPTRRRSITGPCRTNFADAYRRLYEEMTAPSTEGDGA